MSFKTSAKEVAREVLAPKVVIALALAGAVAWSASHAYYLEKERKEKLNAPKPKAELRVARSATLVL